MEEPPIKDTLNKEKTTNKGHTWRLLKLLSYHPINKYFPTSEREDNLPLYKTKFLWSQCVHYSEVPLYNLCYISFPGIIDTFSESLLSYPPGESWATYYFPTFQPVFQPVFQDADLETEANRLCGDDVFCLFDIAATGNTDLGLSTLRTSQEIEKLEELSLPSNSY